MMHDVDDDAYIESLTFYHSEQFSEVKPDKSNYRLSQSSFEVNTHFSQSQIAVVHNLFFFF